MYKKFIKKWIGFVLLLCFSFYMGIKNSQLFFSFLFWFLVSVAALSTFWVLLEYCGSSLKISRTNIPKIQEDESVEINIKIANKGMIPLLNLVVEDSAPCAQAGERKKYILVDYLGISGEKELKYSCFCPLRGLYGLGPVKVYFFDPFGLIFLRKTFAARSELYVYPRTFKVTRFPELTKGNAPWFGIETSRVSGDEDEFFGVREYKSGDPIKKIHWISSARKNELIVKEYQRQSFFKATIVFNLDKENNLGEGKNSVCEYIIKIVASVSKYLINMGVSVEVIAHTDDTVCIEANKGNEHLEDILKFLAMAKIESRVSFMEVFESFSQNISDDSTVIAVMLDKDREYLPNMLSLSARNVAILPIILVTSTFADESLNTIPDDVFDIRLPGIMSLAPIYVLRSDNLEEKF
ncbi:MAG: DUF58 domain-containing protein [Candidatus Omnitrophica bacterium]|nr:DUF58 domain-containing protein [Candidatus Omnitrophota bacterium]